MSALTRILNNQIYNATIVASQKIAPGTIVGSLFASNVTVPGDFLVTGNLTVLGSSAVTTVASTNTYVNDPLIVMNNGFSGTNTYDEGLVFNRGTALNQAFIWSEVNKEFRLIGTTETGTTYGNVGVTNFANLHIGNLTVDYAITTSGTISTPGAVSVGSLNSAANVLATAGTFNALTVNGNESVTGYLNVTGNILSAAITASQLNSSGNILATAGTFNALTVNGNESVTGYLNVTGNVMASAGTLSGLTVNGATTQNGTLTVSSGFINSSGNILATAGTFNGLTVNGDESVTGYLNVTGNVMAAVVTASQLNTTGNVLATAGTFNGLTVNGNELVTGYLNVTGNVMAAAITSSSLNTTGNVLASTVGASFLTASTVAVGNISAVTVGNTGTQFNGSAINLSGNVLAAAGVFNAMTVNGNETVTGYLNVTGNILGDTGTLSVLGVSNTLWANSSTATTTQGTGALIIPTGGISVAGAANIASAVTIGGATQLNNTLSVGGLSYYTNTTNATEATGASGALQIKGGASIAKDLYIGGNIYASNIFSTTYQVITVQDPLLYLDAANTFPYNYDIGFYSNFVGPNPIDNTGNVYQHSGVVRDNTDNTWKFFSNVRSEPSGSSITFNTDTIYDPIKAGNLVLTYTQDATNATTGALQVGGGAGISGNIFMSGAYLNTSASNGLVFNTPTTVDAFKAATTLTLGATTGTLTLRNATVTTPGQIVSTRAGSATTGDGQIYLNGSTSNRIDWAAAGTGAPTFTTRTDGTKVVLYPALSGSTVDYAIGIDAATMWSSVPENDGSFNFKWYGAETLVANLSGTGNFTTVGDVAVNGGDLTTTATTFNLLNAAATTINVGGAATSIVAGAATGTFNIRNANIYLPNAANIASTQGTVAVFNTDTTTVNAFGAASTLNLGATTGTATIGNPTVVGTQTTQYLWNTTATTVNAFQAATTANIGATTGTIQINNPTLVGYNATQALYNTVASTINFGRAANITMGHTDGTTTLQGNANIQSVTSSISAATGALKVKGGVGIGGNLNIAGNNKLTLGLDLVGNSVFIENAAQFATNANAFSRVAIQNISSGTQATSEFIAITNNGSNATGYIATGIAGSGYSRDDLQVGPGTGYTYVSGGPLTLAASGAVNLVSGGYTAGNVIATANGQTGNLAVVVATPGDSPTTGAFTVSGTIGGNANIFINAGATINYGQTSENFVVRGKVTTSLIATNSDYGAVVFGGSNATPTLGAVAKFNSTDSIQIPVGSTAQRPGSTGNVDITGMMRFNNTVNNLEFYDGSNWQAAGSTFTVISDRQFAGNTAYGNVDGVNDTFTIQANATTASTIVSINGVMQFPVLAYSVSGATMTFTEPPALDDVIDVRVLATTTVVSTLASGNGYNQFIADNTGATIWTGTSATTERIIVDPVGDVNYLTGNKESYTQTAVNIAANNTPYVISTWSQTSYSSAKYVIQAKKDGTRIESMEAMVITDGSGNAYVTTYAIINNGTAMGTLSANVLAGNVDVWYTTTTNMTNANVKAKTTLIV